MGPYRTIAPSLESYHAHFEHDIRRVRRLTVKFVQVTVPTRVLRRRRRLEAQVTVCFPISPSLRFAKWLSFYSPINYQRPSSCAYRPNLRYIILSFEVNTTNGGSPKSASLTELLHESQPQQGPRPAKFSVDTSCHPRSISTEKPLGCRPVASWTTLQLTSKLTSA